MTRAELMEIGAIIGPLSDAISYLTSEQRTKLLQALLMQEVCKLPPGERDHELALIIADLPGVMRATEEGMRIALVENARGGGVMELLLPGGRPLGRSGDIEPLTSQRFPHKPQYVAGQGVTHRLRSLLQRGTVLCGHPHRKLNFLCHYVGILWLTLVDGIARIPLRHDGVQGTA